MKIPSIITANSAVVKPISNGSFSVDTRLIDSFNNPFGSDTHFNLLVSSIYNQSDKEKRSWMKNSLPSRELGMSILLTSINSSRFFEALRLEEINLVLSLSNVANAWSRSVADLHNPSWSAANNVLGLTNLCLGLSGIDATNKEFVIAFLTSAMSELSAITLKRFKEELSSDFKSKKNVGGGRYDSFSYKNLKTGMSAVEEVNDHFMTVLRSVLLSFNIDKHFNEQLAKNTFAETPNAEELFIVSKETGVIGFVSAMDEFSELFKLYLLTLSAQINVETETMGYSSQEWQQSMIKSVFSKDAIATFVNQGIVDPPSGDPREDGGIKLNLVKLWGDLQTELTRNIAKNTSLSLMSIRQTIRDITSFKHEFIKFIDNQSGFLTDSYKNGDQLFRAYKSFLVDIKNATDPVSANAILTSFRGSKLFSNSMAGLVHGMCSNRESVDASVVNDIAQIVIDEQVIAAFNRGPFKDVATLKLMPAIISDYGTGLKGMSYEVYYESERAFTFDSTKSIAFAAEGASSGLLAATSPWESKACLEEYCIRGSMIINDPEIRRIIAGGADMTNIRSEFEASRAVREVIDSALRMINNAISVQLYVHYNASRAWYKQYLLGIWDYSSYFKNIFDLKENFLSHHPFRDKIEGNLLILQTELRATLEEMYSITVEAPPTNTLPVIKIDAGEGTITSDPQIIMNTMLDLLYKKTSFMHMMEDMKMVKRFMSRVGKEGTGLMRSNRINDMNANILQAVGLFIKSSNLEAEALEVRPSAEMVATLASVNEAKDQMFRSLDAAQWLYLFDVDETLSVLNSTQTKKKRSGVDKAKFGRHAEAHSHAPTFVYDLIQTMAAERLVNYYQVDTFASLKYAKAIRSMSKVSQNIVKLAVDGREGMSVGVTPIPVTFTSESDANTMYQILAHLGLTEDMMVKITDVVFFNAISEASSLGFPFKLTSQVQKKLRDSSENASLIKDDESVERIRLKDALALSPAFAMNKSALKTFTIYLRDTKIINFMLNDIIMESFVDDYQLVQIKDDYVKALLGNEPQDKFLAVSISEGLDLEDISNSTRLPAMLRLVAEKVSEFFFPMASLDKLSNVAVKKADDLNPEIDPEDEDPTE